MKFKSILSMLLCGILLFGCCAMAGCSGDSDKDTDADNTNKDSRVLDGAKLITYGDSLTAFGTWPLTVAENTNMYLFNGATGGINTKEGLARFESYVAAHDPDFVTLLFGMNDLLMQVKNVPQVTPDQFKANMKTMCEQVVALDAVPILLTSSYMDESIFFQVQAQNESYYEKVGTPLEWLDQYNAKVRELAAEEGYHMIDIREACNDYSVKEFLSSDGIHLGDKGNEVYAELISEYLLDNFTSDPDAEKITGRFPYKASPAEPATTDIISYDPADWVIPEEYTMNIVSGENGELLLSNLNGAWPAAEYSAKECVLVPVEGTELVFDFSTANVNTSILLFFGGATPHASTAGKYVAINTYLGVNTDCVGDIYSNQDCKGSVLLSEILKDSSASDAIDENGNVLISGARVFVAGNAAQNVTIRQLAVSTTGAPNEE